MVFVFIFIFLGNLCSANFNQFKDRCNVCMFYFLCIFYCMFRKRKEVYNVAPEYHTLKYLVSSRKR